MKRIISQGIEDPNIQQNDFSTDFTDHRNRRLQSAINESMEHLREVSEMIANFQNNSPEVLYEDMLQDETISSGLRQVKYFLSGFLKDV